MFNNKKETHVSFLLLFYCVIQYNDDLNSSHSSNFSYEQSLWEIIKNNYNFIMNNCLLEDNNVIL